MEKRQSANSTWLYPVVLILALAMFGVGIYLLVAGRTNSAMITAGSALLAAGGITLVASLVTWPICSSLNNLRTATAEHERELLNMLTDRLQQLSVLLNLVNEQQLLSDRAKSVAFREKDRDALRRAIREEMGKKDWEAALVLANDMEHEFGYRQESDQFRQEINQNRNESARRQIAEAVAAIDRHCRVEMWADALHEAERIAHLLPGNEQVARLPADVETRRQNHKRQLMESWQEAVNRHDVDGSIAILKKLDLYLTPSEAESMQETARGVFKEKLNNLRTQFTLAVQDHKWAEAVRVGDAIMHEFPNAKIAQEVKEKMDTLRQRSNEGTPVGA